MCIVLPGDLLSLTLKGLLEEEDLDDVSSATVVSATPLRIQTVPMGRVTNWFPKFSNGVIDDTIYFDHKCQTFFFVFTNH